MTGLPTAPYAQLRARELRILHEAAWKLSYVELCESNPADGRRNGGGGGVIEAFLPWMLAWATPSSGFYHDFLAALDFFHGDRAWGRREGVKVCLAQAFQHIAEVDRWYRARARGGDFAASASNGALLLAFLLRRPPKEVEAGASQGKERRRDTALRPGSLLDETVVAAALVCLAPALWSPPTLSSSSPSSSSSWFGGMEEVEKQIHSLLLSFPLVLRRGLLPWWRQRRLAREELAGVDRCFARVLPPAAAPPTLRRMAITWFLATRGVVDCALEPPNPSSLRSDPQDGLFAKGEVEAGLAWIRGEGERLFVELLESGARARAPPSREGEEETPRLDGMRLPFHPAPALRRRSGAPERAALKVRALLRSALPRGFAVEVLSQCFPEVEARHLRIRKEPPPPPLAFTSGQGKDARVSSSKGSPEQSLPPLGEVELECLLSIAGDKLSEEVKTTLCEINRSREAENRSQRAREELRVAMQRESTRKNPSNSTDIMKNEGVHVKSEAVAAQSQNLTLYWMNLVLRLTLQPTGHKDEYNDDHSEQVLYKAEMPIHANRQRPGIPLRKRATPGEQLHRILSTETPRSPIPDQGIDKDGPPHRGLHAKSWKDIFYEIRTEIKDLQRHAREASSPKAHFCTIEHMQGDLNIQEQLEALILRECLGLYDSDKSNESIRPQEEEADLRNEQEDALWMINSLILCLDVIQKGSSLPFVMTSIYPMCSLAQTPQDSPPPTIDRDGANKDGNYSTTAIMASLKKWCKFVQYHVHELLFETPLVERFSEEAMRVGKGESTGVGVVDRPLPTPAASAIQRASAGLAHVTRPLMAFLRLLSLEGCLVELRLEKLLRQQPPPYTTGIRSREKCSTTESMLRSIEADQARTQSILRDLYVMVREPISTALLDLTATGSLQSSLLWENADVVRSGLQTAILVGAWKDLRWICERLLLSRRAQEPSGRTSDEEMSFLARLLPVSVAALFASLNRPNGSGSFSDEFKSFASSLVQTTQKHAELRSSCGDTKTDEKAADLGHAREGAFEDFIKFLSALERSLRGRVASATTRLRQEAYRQPRYVERLALARPLHVFSATFENSPLTGFPTYDEKLGRMQRFLSFSTLLIHPMHGTELWNRFQRNRARDHGVDGEEDTHIETAHGHTASLSEETVKSAVSCLLKSSPGEYEAFKRLESKLPARRRPEAAELEKASEAASNSSSKPIERAAGGKAIQEAWRVWTTALLHHPNLLPKETVLRVFWSLRHIPHTKHFISMALSEAVIEASPTFQDAIEAVRMSLSTLPHGGATAVQHHMLLGILDRLCGGAAEKGEEGTTRNPREDFRTGLEDYTYTPKREFWNGPTAPFQVKKGLVAVVCACHDLLHLDKGKRPGTPVRPVALVPQHLLVRLLHAAVGDAAVTRHLYRLFWSQPYSRVEGVKVFLSALKAARDSRGLGQHEWEQEDFAARAMMDFLFLCSGVVEVVRTQHGEVATTDEVTQRRPQHFSAENHRVLWQAFVHTCRSRVVAEATALQIVRAYKSCRLIDEVEELLVNASYEVKK
ncbi:unnamed protein product [Phytomonas sp. EM1]|nr:unnamed protein product [Phytomonas sp. EM1]|eukprot:CCW65795.1 unnamed protein product [Phytomonas sp. isolate EM1]